MKDESRSWFWVTIMVSVVLLVSWVTSWATRPAATEPEFRAWEKITGNTNHLTFEVFWGPEDVVMQLHPKESEYVNLRPGCLHLWRPTDREIPTPPSIMVGPKGGQR